ncbi:MAG: YeeE/YedE family protein [Proteobacteria bacterium]|jgi:uncharacterized membrane protein YedE/YeeE|nr:YeeE/YedE family protein [Pseudomonadota bacterium]
MTRKASIFLSGLLFSMGLFISGMTNPEKVLSFLDITGNWDPTLAFVMVGAIVPTFILYRVVFRRSSPVFGSSFDLPTKRELDHRLILGAIVFGIGWGMSGVCPGPGIANVFAGNWGFLLFVGAMLLGMRIGERR